MELFAALRQTARVRLIPVGFQRLTDHYAGYVICPAESEWQVTGVFRGLVIHAAVLLIFFSPWTCRKYVLKCICLFRNFKTVLDGPVKIIMLSAMSQCYLP